MTQALIEATRTAEAFTAALPPGGWMGRGGGAGTIALADVPLMSVTAPGVVRVTPGDWVGKPGMTPGFGNFNMDRPISLTIPVHVGGRLVDNYVVETTLRKLEQNDSGGANLSYRTRLNRVIG
jgi:hypothetical protein